jgi:hypothetical protein
MEFGNVVAGQPSGREQNIRRPRKTDVLVNQTLLRILWGGRGQPDEQIFRQIHNNLIGSIQVVRSTIRICASRGARPNHLALHYAGRPRSPADRYISRG